MRYSVFTPTHDTRHLGLVYDSLLAQTDQDWEWLIVPNGAVCLPSLPDPRVRILPRQPAGNVGALKAYACSRARGEWLVELDHDDELLPTALERIGASTADFAYSNAVLVNDEWDPVLWRPDCGWEWRPVEVHGHQVVETVAPEPLPSNLSRIWFAPDHLRAWRREFYERLGGHDTSMELGDDHELVCRSALEGTVEHIDEPLYVYHVHGGNTWLANAERIERIMWKTHGRYFLPLAERWARESALGMMDLGGALDAPDGYVTVDRQNADIVCDLNEDWPLGTGTVGILRAHDVLEHLRDPIHAMNEAWRVLAHGGVFDILVPSTDGQGAWCDPTHVSFWNKRSFTYYTQAGMRRYLEPECHCQFQVVQLEDVMMWEGVPYVQAQLLALHDGPRFHGVVEW